MKKKTFETIKPQEQGEEEKERVEEALKKTKDSISREIVDEINKEDDEDVNTFEQKIKRSVELGRAAGEFFQFLIPKSPRKPEKEYDGETEESEFEEEAREAIEVAKRIREKFTEEQFAAEEVNGIKVYFPKEELQETCKEKEIEIAPGERALAQHVTFRFKQDESPNMIEENLTNLVTEEMNIPAGSLTIINPESEMRLELKKMLPEGYEFVPKSMEEKKHEIIENNGKPRIKITPIPQSLKDYKGSKYAGKYFAAVRYKKIIQQVQYGNLVEKGNILVLLHEIAHTWQNVYREDDARGDFEEFHKEVMRSLTILAWYKEQRKNQKWTGAWTKEAFEEDVIQPSLEELEELGVRVDMETFDDPGRPPGDKETQLFGGGRMFTATVNAEKFERLMYRFEQAEREAWAHAIKVLRFLRRRGFDLEPGLSSEDMKEKIDTWLGSYDRAVNAMMQSSARPTRFVSKSQK